MIFDVINEVKRAADIRAGDLVIHYDKAYRVKSVRRSRYDWPPIALDLMDNGVEYERFCEDDLVPTIRIAVTC